MKIGILTQPISNNYGGILQNYALQTILMQMGHKVETLNWDMYVNDRKYETFIQHAVQVIKTFISRYFLKRTRNYYWEQKALFYQLSAKNQPFIRQHIKLSEFLLEKSQFREYVIKKQYDTLIVGSDQVWRPEYNKNEMLFRMFLDFASDLKIRRIAYAASFGVDVWEYNHKQTIECSQLLQAFDAISVREQSGVQLCQKYLNIPNVKWVLDPTLLLVSSDYEKLLCKDVKTSLSNKKLVTIYILDNSENKQRMIQEVINQKSHYIKEFIPRYCNLNTITKSAIDDYKYPSVVEWLQALHDADYVISDSFHGTVFSIIFNKPFIAIGNKNRGYGRFLSLLKLFNLENNLVDDTTSVNHIIEIINTPINWKQVNEKLDKLKQHSIQFLENALEASQNSNEK